jgi:hypothetical protein
MQYIGHESWSMGRIGAAAYADIPYPSVRTSGIAEIMEESRTAIAVNVIAFPPFA